MKERKAAYLFPLEELVEAPRVGLRQFLGEPVHQHLLLRVEFGREKHGEEEETGGCAIGPSAAYPNWNRFIKEIANL